MTNTTGQAPFLCLGVTDRGPKAYRAGTHRAVAPAETLARLRPRMKEMGITRVANVTGLDRIGIPVVMVCRPNARSIAVSQGKGLDLDAAKASGLMEAIEVHHAECIAQALKLASHEELVPDHRLVDLEGLPRVAGRSFDPRQQILWIEGHDLVSQTALWVPLEVVHANYTLPQPPVSGCFEASTNGLASGNHLLEAVNHGICEVVERDSTSLWNQLDQAARDRTQLDLETVTDQACRHALAQLAQAGIEVAVWETTTDTAIPAFYCMVIDRQVELAHPGAGAGCHPAREVALLRAVTEAVQVRTTYIAGSRDDLLPSEYTRAAILEKRQLARNLIGRRPSERDFGSVVSQDSETFGDDLVWLLGRLRSVGVEQVIAIDLTKPEFQIPVARVIIPGLEGPDDHEGYLPGARAQAARKAGP